MAQTWPVGVPDCLERGSLNEMPVDAVLRTNVDIGKPMTRNRYTGEIYRVAWRIQMTAAERDILVDWYHNTLGRVLTFNFTHPLTSVVREYSFITPPKSTHIGGDQFIVSFDLETV